MDILRKMFKLTEDPKKDSSMDQDSSAKDEFRKPQWFEEAETDDELFGDDRKFAFQVFTNPMELQKHFERQMQQILEAVSEIEGREIPVEKNLKEEFLKPGFEEHIFKEFEKHKNSLSDTDLDGEIYADQLHSLMQRLTEQDRGEQFQQQQISSNEGIIPRNDNKTTRKIFPKKILTDEEKILGRIHGTIPSDESAAMRQRPRAPRPEIMTPMTPLIPRSATPFGGVFEGSFQGPKMFSQSIMTKTIRKPDGTYETTKVTQDSEGNRTTTITRTVNGKTEIITKHHDAKKSDGKTDANIGRINRFALIPYKQTDEAETNSNGGDESSVYSDRNVYVTKQGYAIPRNLW